MHLSKKLNIFAICLCILFFFGTIFSVQVLAEHADHDIHECADEDCAICSQITSTRERLGHFRAESLAAGVLFTLPGIGLLMAGMINPDIQTTTLISQKVRLDC